MDGTSNHPRLGTSLDSLINSIICTGDHRTAHLSALAIARILKPRAVLRPIMKARSEAVGTLEGDMHHSGALKGGSNDQIRPEPVLRIQDVQKLILRAFCVETQIFTQIKKKRILTYCADPRGSLKPHQKTKIIPVDSFLWQIMGPALQPVPLSTESDSYRGTVFNNMFNKETKREKSSLWYDVDLQVTKALGDKCPTPDDFPELAKRIKSMVAVNGNGSVVRGYTTFGAFDPSLAQCKNGRFRFGTDQFDKPIAIDVCTASLIWKTLSKSEHTLVLRILKYAMLTYKGRKRIKKGGITDICKYAEEGNEITNETIEGILESFESLHGVQMFISEQRSTDLLSNLRECDEYGNYTTWLPDPALPATQASESSGDCCFYKQIASLYWDDNNACISIFPLIMESIMKEPLRHKKDDFGEYDVILSVAWEMATTATTEMMSDALGC